MNFNPMKPTNEVMEEQAKKAAHENETRDFSRRAASAYNADDFVLALAAVADGPAEKGDEI